MLMQHRLRFPTLSCRYQIRFGGAAEKSQLHRSAAKAVELWEKKLMAQMSGLRLSKKGTYSKPKLKVIAKASLRNSSIKDRIFRLKPKVFIGSSREGVQIADAIHSNLTYEAECTVWKDGVFQLSGNILSSLIEVLRGSDFGIFVFSPDDITVMRNASNSTVRDNVIFELGLFIGRLGQERCFFLIPDGASDLRLPSDFAGVTPGRYEGSRSDGNWMAALNPTCRQIKLQMDRLKSFQDAVPPTPSRDKSLTQKKSTDAQEKARNGISAKYYKKSILVSGDTLPHKEKLTEIGNWNGALNGWVIPRSREDKLRANFKDIKIMPDET